jgi:hypothetical protein
MQETLFILEKAGLFGTKAGEVYQVNNTLVAQTVYTYTMGTNIFVSRGDTHLIASCSPARSVSCQPFKH